MGSVSLYEVFATVLIVGVAIGAVVVLAVAAVIVGSELRGSWGRWSRRWHHRRTRAPAPVPRPGAGAHDGHRRRP